VDDAIVMLENIVRHIEMGESRCWLAQGSAEIGFTIVSMTLSLAAVFIPVLFMGGVLGRCSRNSRLPSAWHSDFRRVSRHADPMLCSRFLTARTTEARLVLQLTEKVLRRHAARLRRDAADGAAPSACS
jgi:HAE1 family hydrophobic/amphiphilic exporter-1